MRVALLGGAFDPPTRAHLALSRELLAQSDVDLLVWLPTWQHRFGKKMSAFDARVQWCRLATEGVSRLEVQTWEEDFSHATDGSTWDLIQQLRIHQPDWELIWIIGQDNAERINEWKRGVELCAQLTFWVVPRPGSSPIDPRDPPWYMCSPHVFWEQIPALDCSSTQARAALAQGQNTEAWLSPEVAQLVREHFT